MQKSIIKKIESSGLCLGCGFCEAVLGKENCKMQLRSDDFFHPEYKYQNKKGELSIKKIYPT